MDVLVVVAVVLGVLLAGAVVALALEIRRGRARPPERRTVPAREALAYVDLATRTLAAGCARAGRDVPDVYVVVCAENQVTLRLARPDTNPPAPWKSDKPGEEWSTPRAGLTGADGPQPFPLTVTLGLHGGDWVLADLARPSGPIAVTGEPADVRRLVGVFVTEIVTGPMGDLAEVVLVGSRAAATLADRVGVRSARLRTATTLDEALARSAGPISTMAGVTEIYGLIQGGAGQQALPTPRLLVLDAAQFRGEASATAGRDRAVLVLGDVPEAAWRLAVRADGTLDTGPLGLDIDTGAGRLQ